MDSNKKIRRQKWYSSDTGSDRFLLLSAPSLDGPVVLLVVGLRLVGSVLNGVVRLGLVDV